MLSGGAVPSGTPLTTTFTLVTGAAICTLIVAIPETASSSAGEVTILCRLSMIHFSTFSYAFSTSIYGFIKLHERVRPNLADAR
jgi:hypothetical protein